MEVSTEYKQLDFDYIFRHCDQSTYDIPHSFDRIIWKIGETYKIRIGNIYDPSKFWIVLYEKEVTVFQKFIHKFYQERGEEYRMPKEVIKRNRYCIAYTEGAYYRGVIVDIPQFTNIELSAVVFLFDFGFTTTVPIEDLFYIYENMYDIPRFAIRACLTGIEPVDSDSWTSKSVERFNELTMGKVLLCVLESRDLQTKTVYIRVGEVTPFNQINEIGNTLLEEKLAKASSGKKHKIMKSKGKLLSTVRYPFLFPSHQALETGLMPSTTFVAEMIKGCPLPASILYKPYLKYHSP